jgi:hypothetical protein
MHRHAPQGVATEAQATVGAAGRGRSKKRMPVCNGPDRGSRFALARKRADLLQVRRRKAFANFNMALRVVCPQGPTFAQWVSTLEKVWQHSEVTLRHNALRLQASPWTGTSLIGDWFK